MPTLTDIKLIERRIERLKKQARIYIIYMICELILALAGILVFYLASNREIQTVTVFFLLLDVTFFLISLDEYADVASKIELWQITLPHSGTHRREDPAEVKT